MLGADASALKAPPELIQQHAKSKQVAPCRRQPPPTPPTPAPRGFTRVGSKQDNKCSLNVLTLSPNRTLN